ncbi:DUF4328 domain-containing protein [Haloechinothrix sp. YIM 98757]|uniref:DUF4328 domain-containing protein n=1 Tax=Haloechinothrix aidingensis TaxID=2752311 RepID=A0A838AE29_9PSEU|nr:DUF4328 domain-containing protein [Haloechinothrix aidingensis]MBA0127483.1 DUF4328 domain-containing protein [Haloechinothrix aidingensis]
MTGTMPPEPGDHPSPPSTTTRPTAPRPVRRLFVAAATLVGIVALIDVIYSIASWNSYRVWADYYDNVAGVDVGDLEAADKIFAVITVPYIIAFIAAAVLFIVWLWMARANAEQRCLATHRRARGWVIGSWFVPVVNLWFPYQVVRDVWRASDPTTPHDHRGGLAQLGGSAIIGWWWFSVLAMGFANRLSFSLERVPEYLDDEHVRRIALADTLAAACTLAAATLIIVIMRRVTTWQHPAAPIT